MMKPIRPHISKGGSYPPEFREEAVRYWLSSGETLAVVASDLGLSPQCLRDWRKQMESATGAAVADQRLPIRMSMAIRMNLPWRVKSASCDVNWKP